MHTLAWHCSHATHSDFPSFLPIPPSIPQALLMQDLKTEDPRQPGGYARRRITKGSIVLVRGEEDEDGRPATWVAVVRKVRVQLQLSAGWATAAGRLGAA